jgi:hypothetical protein
VSQAPEEVAARQAIEAQLLARDDRILASQRAAVDSAKLVSTFVLALAGTLVGTALQVTQAGGEMAAVILLALSTVFALAVILLDQLDIPKFDKVTASTDVVRQEKMQLAVDMVVEANEKTKNIVQVFALLSVLTAAAAGVASVMALMLK